MNQEIFTVLLLYRLRHMTCSQITIDLSVRLSGVGIRPVAKFCRAKTSLSAVQVRDPST